MLGVLDSAYCVRLQVMEAVLSLLQTARMSCPSSPHDNTATIQYSSGKCSPVSKRAVFGRFPGFIRVSF